MPKKAAQFLFLACLVLQLAVLPVAGQTELGSVLKKQYSLRSVSCNSCHCKDEEEKTGDNLTPFGGLIAKLAEGQRISERLNAIELVEDDYERDAKREAFEKEFAALLKKLDAIKGPHGRTYAELIRGGQIDGIMPRK